MGILLWVLLRILLKDFNNLTTTAGVSVDQLQ